MFKFEILQAQHGDCFVIRWDGNGKVRLAVVDGGPSGVYQTLKARLAAIKGASPKLDIDWVMVSHIDDDHVNGLLEMMTEMRNAQDENRTHPYHVRRFWFNSFEDLAAVQPEGSNSAVAAVASVAESLPFDAGGMSHETRAVLASVGQGRNLRDAIDALGLGGNSPIGGFIQADVGQVDIDGLKVTVIGPLREQLAALRNDWAKAPKARTAEAASYADKSVANLSSIVCHVAFEKAGETRTMLLTGDARGDYILEGLERSGLLTEGVLKLDLLKVQHHGSDRDVVKEFFRRTPAKHYVISANGKYNNPDEATLNWLIEARGDDEYTIHLSNQLPWMKSFFDDLQTGHRFRLCYRGKPDDAGSVDEIDLD
jgi:hypothetical protein